jgi:hypothetical protein
MSHAAVRVLLALVALNLIVQARAWNRIAAADNSQIPQRVVGR